LVRRSWRATIWHKRIYIPLHPWYDNEVINRLFYELSNENGIQDFNVVWSGTSDISVWEPNAQIFIDDTISACQLRFNYITVL
jgi:hypothetical protein